VDQQGAVGNGLRRFAIQAGIYLGVFLGGAILSFAYSYAPLHNAKNWKIGYLEERLLAKDAEIEALGAKLRQLEGSLSDVPDGETFKVLQDELVTADKTVKRLEQEVSKLEKRAKEAERPRDQWKARLAEAEKARVTTRAQPASAPASPAADATPAPGPAAAAPAARSIVAKATVPVGSRWHSPDGKSDFDLVAIEDGRARVVPDASQLRPGSVPKTRDVAPGESFSVAGPDVPREVIVRSIDGTESVAVEVRE